jgi:excisionase family DNA binding protein
MKTQVGDLMTVKELAALINLSVGTIRRGEGGTRDLPYLKLGGAVRYRRQDVERWLESKTHEPVAEPRLLRRYRAKSA